MFKKTTFENKLRLVTSAMRETRTVTVLVMVATGSRYETKQTNGISHFLEHMLFKGTKKRPTALDITEEIDRVGGEYNAFTSKEYTGYYAKVASKHKKLIMDVISDIFLNSKLNPEDIEKEKGVIVEEINMDLDTPASYVRDLFEALLYGDQSLGWPIIGTKENVKALNRDKLIEYFERQYVASNTVVIVTGNIDEEETAGEVIEYFKSIKEDGYMPKSPIRETQDKPASLVHYKKTDQTHLCLGVRSYGLNSEDYFILEVLASILGGGMSSRLFTEVREKRGLAYYIHCSSKNYTDTGYLLVQAGVGNDKVNESIKVILDEFCKMKNKKVPNNELTKAKEYIKGKLLLSLESSSAVAFWLGYQEILKGKILTVNETFERIDKVTSEDIQRVANDIFQDNKLNLALIGPFKDGEKFNKILRV